MNNKKDNNPAVQQLITKKSADTTYNALKFSDRFIHASIMLTSRKLNACWGHISVKMIQYMLADKKNLKKFNTKFPIFKKIYNPCQIIDQDTCRQGYVGMLNLNVGLGWKYHLKSEKTTEV